MQIRIAAICLIGWFLSVGTAAAAESTIPPFEEIQSIVEGYFHADREYQPGDLIMQGEIEEVLSLIQQAGWTVPEGDKLVARGVPENSFLAQEFATKDGRAFIRQIAKFPGAYPRLDRLSTISGGETLIRDLTKKRGGDVLIQYLATTKQGHNLGQMMSGVQKGVDLNKPTGRIYTADDLLAELKKRYRK